MRLQPSVWSKGYEAYLAELYVVPGRRGHGHGRELITAAIRVARERGAGCALVVTSEEDRLAQRLYEAPGSAAPRARAVRSCWMTFASDLGRPPG